MQSSCLGIEKFIVNFSANKICGMLKYIFFTSCFLLFIGCKEVDKEPITLSDPVADEPIAKWQSVVAKDNSKPVQRHEAAFVQVGDKFYLLGGRSIRAVSIYDTNTESWSLGAQPPIELHHFQPVVYQDKVYVIAAMTGGWPNETPTTHVYIYDPATDAWSTGDEIPEERRRGSTGNVLHNGKIYVSCGIKNGHIGDHKDWMDSYDPNTGEWIVLANAPRSRDHFQSVLVGGKIYNLAGRNTGSTNDPFGGTIGETDVYDIATNSWKTLSNTIPTQRAGNAAIFFDNKILVVGGESQAQVKAHSEVEALSLPAETWETLEPLLEGRHGTGLIDYNDALYIASGCGNRGGEPELFTMEKYSK